jgi:transposase-like protein
MPKPKRDTGTEVVAAPQNDRRQRRRFAPEDKARILREAEGCTERGQLAALLRREGIYSSHLTSWRVLARREGEAGLAAKKPGPKPTKDAKDKIIERLEKQKARLEKELRISRKLIELQVKAHEILGIALPRVEEASEDDLSTSSESATKRSR